MRTPVNGRSRPSVYSRASSSAPLRQSDEDIAQNRLRNARPKRRPHAAAGTRRSEKILGVTHHVAKRDAATVGLTLAHVVPVVAHGDPFGA